MTMLQGRRILVVEDDYLLAQDMRRTLQKVGAEVLGPVPDVSAALDLVASAGPIDAGLLDVNLNGERVFPVAEALARDGVPFAFATGYDAWALPENFAHIPRVEKPANDREVVALLARLL